MELEPELMLQEARESVEAAQSYRRELSQRLQGLREARRQIKESASQTRDVLKQHFNDLKGTLAKLLDERLVTLLQEVDTIEQETIKPLDDCQKLIEHGVNTAEDLVQEGGRPGSLLNAAHSGRHCAGFPGHQQASCHLWVLRLFVPWESL